VPDAGEGRASHGPPRRRKVIVRSEKNEVPCNHRLRRLPLLTGSCLHFPERRNNSITCRSIAMRSLTGLLFALSALAIFSGRVTAAELNPAAVAYTLPDKIEWKPNVPGSEQAVLAGDPTKPGLYVMMIKWLPGHMSVPHFHPNDRFIMVLKGPWWMGTGAKVDPAGMVP